MPIQTLSYSLIACDDPNCEKNKARLKALKASEIEPEEKPAVFRRPSRKAIFSKSEPSTQKQDLKVEKEAEAAPKKVRYFVYNRCKCDESKHHANKDLSLSK